MNCLFFSGGGTKFVGLATMGSEIIKDGYEPNVIGGVSAGALLSVPLALGMVDEVLEIGLKMQASDMFSVPPTNNKGSITWRGIWRAITGKPSLGVQDTRKFVMKTITEKRFNEYIRGKYPICYAMAVNFIYGNRRLWNLKECTYEQYIDAVSASSHIPVTTQPVIIDGEPYFDGGVRDHIPSNVILEKMALEKNVPTHVISVYSRPKDNVIFNHQPTKNVMSVLKRTIEIMNVEISKSDELQEAAFCEKNGVELRQYFLPHVLDSFYDNSIENKIKLIQEARNAYKIQTSNYIMDKRP